MFHEAASGVQRAVSENTADKTAEERFLHLIEEILPKNRVAEQALRDKLLGVRGYTPAPETRLLWRRFQAEANLFRAENVPIETALAKLSNQYDKIVGAMTIEWDGVAETMPQAALRLRDPRPQRARARLASDHGPLAARAGNAQRPVCANAGAAPQAGEQRGHARLSRLCMAGTPAIRLHPGRLLYVPRCNRARGRAAGAEAARRSGRAA